MKPRLRQHILFWVAYLLFEAYVEFAWLSASTGTTPPIDRWWMAFFGEMTQLTVKIPLTYFLIRRVLAMAAKRNPFLQVLAAIGGVAMGVLLQRLLIILFILPSLYHEPASTAFILNWPRIITTGLDLLLVVGVAIAIKQYRLSLRAQEKEKGLVKEKLEAELKFLRTQTNPHFLFNTLNNIYALARKKSDETADVVLKLSKLLRFMLYESRRERITVSEELRVLDDYIELEKIRYNDRLQIHFERDIDDDLQEIAPLILLPFVENAFKHGASETRFDSFIHLSVHLRKGQLNFIIKNSSEQERSEDIHENIGLSNVRRQLELTYPQHRLYLWNEHKQFTVQLTINLLHETV